MSPTSTLPMGVPLATCHSFGSIKITYPTSHSLILTLMFAVGTVSQVNVRRLAWVGSLYHTPPAAHASALALSAQEISISWALVSVMTPLTVMVWRLPDQEEELRVTVNLVGGGMAPTS